MKKILDAEERPLERTGVEADRRRSVSPVIDPDRSGLVESLRIAALEEDWAEVARVWGSELEFGEGGLDQQVARILAALPQDARREYPDLTYAWAQSSAVLEPAAARDQTQFRCLTTDALAIHAGWQDAPTTDRGVISGIIWMMFQRSVPTAGTASALEEARRTQSQIAGFIEQRRAIGRPASPRVEVRFRAAAAQLALWSGDSLLAISHSNYAVAIASDTTDSLTRGTRALAQELNASGIPPAGPAAWRSAGVVAGLGPGAFDSSCGLLAEAMSALRTLNRRRSSLTLAELAPLGEGNEWWPVVGSLRLLHAILWGDVAEELARTDSISARAKVTYPQEDGLLPGHLLRRSRIMALVRLTAFGPASASAASLPFGWRRIARASIAIWSGEMSEAAKLAETGLLYEDLPAGDRPHLIAIKAAADLALSQGSRQASEQACRVVTELLGENNLLALALLPAQARVAMLAAYAQLGSGSGSQSVMLERFGDLVEYAAPTPGPNVLLTPRERVLLPLLANSETVPEIAAALSVSPNTVRKQVVKIRAKFGAKSRSELVRKARAQGVLR